MKKIVFSIIYFLLFLIQFKNNREIFYFLSLISSIILPILLSLIFLLVNHEKFSNVKDRCYKVIDVWINISILIFTFIIANNLINNHISNNNTFISIISFIYYTLLLFEVFIVNFFLSIVFNYENTYMKLIYSIKKFLSKNIFLTILIIIFSIFIENDDVSMAIIGSFIFYLLSEISKHINKDDIKMELPNNKIILANITLFIFMYIFEQLFITINRNIPLQLISNDEFLYKFIWFSPLIFSLILLFCLIYKYYKNLK